jgi:hypothetical protein
MSDESKRFAETLQAILRLAKSTEGARYALAQLFPKVESQLRTFVPSGSMDSTERKRQHRISERDFAPAYFRLDPQPAAWSRSEIETILNAAEPAEAVAMPEKRVNAASENDRPRLRRLFLEALDGAFGVLRPFNLNWLLALLDLGKRYIIAGDET